MNSRSHTSNARSWFVFVVLIAVLTWPFWFGQLLALCFRLHPPFR